MRLQFLLPIGFLMAVLHYPAVPSLRPAAPKPVDTPSLESVLKKMDSTAANFRTTQAEFEWDIYQKVIDSVDDVETGTIYYRRDGKDIDMMAEVKKGGPSSDPKDLKPESRFVLYSGGKIRLYEPKIDRLTEVDLGKNQADYQSYLVLGFGGSGEELQKTFDVSYAGPETVGGVATAKLKLIPKSQKIRDTYSEIYLWIDLDRGISVKQQFMQSSGDYRLATYSGIQINGKKIPDDVFKLKTTGKTQVVTPKG